MATSAQGHTAGWIYSDIERVTNKHHETKFVGAVTNNTPANVQIPSLHKKRSQMVTKKSTTVVIDLISA